MKTVKVQSKWIQQQKTTKFECDAHWSLPATIMQCSTDHAETASKKSPGLY